MSKSVEGLPEPGWATGHGYAPEELRRYAKGGCFETARVYAGRIPGFSLHRNRMEEGCRQLGIRLPDLFASEEALVHTTRLGTVPEFRIRWEVLLLDAGQTSTIVEWSAAPESRPITLLSARQPYRPADGMSPLVKWSDRRLYDEAEKALFPARADMAILTDENGTVVETTRAALLTGSPGPYRLIQHPWALPSTAAAILCAFFDSSGIAYVHERVSLATLKQAESIWALNALHPIRPVISMDGVRFDSNMPEWAAAYQMFFRRYGS